MPEILSNGLQTVAPLTTDKGMKLFEMIELLAGSSSNSNVSIINNLFDDIGNEIQYLKDSHALLNVDATYVSSDTILDYFDATVIDLVNYSKGMIFVLSLSQNNDRGVSVDINSLGSIPVKKYAKDGTLVNLEPCDFYKNQKHFVQYDGESFVVLSDLSVQDLKNINDTITKHIQDQTKHISVDDRKKWDAKSLVTKSDKNGNVIIDGVEIDVYKHPEGTNPHNTTKSDIGLSNVTNERQYSEQNPPPYPVTSVNGKQGAVILKVSDINNDLDFQSKDSVEKTVNNAIEKVVGGNGGGSGITLKSLLAQINQLADKANRSHYIIDSKAPNIFTVGVMGQRWLDKSTGRTYICTGGYNGSYEWTQILNSDPDKTLYPIDSPVYTKEEQTKLNSLENFDPTPVENHISSVERELSVKSNPPKEYIVSFSASKWGNSAPYTQTVKIDGMVSDGVPVYDLQSFTEELSKEFKKITKLETAAGSVTATALKNKPEQDLTIRVIVLGSVSGKGKLWDKNAYVDMFATKSTASGNPIIVNDSVEAPILGYKVIGEDKTVSITSIMVSDKVSQPTYLKEYKLSKPVSLGKNESLEKDSTGWGKKTSNDFVLLPEVDQKTLDSISMLYPNTVIKSQGQQEIRYIADEDIRDKEMQKSISNNTKLIDEVKDDMFNALNPPFEESGVFVTCSPTVDTTLNVTSKITPAQSGNGDPSPDNIRLIKGYTTAKLTICGKNIAANIQVASVHNAGDAVLSVPREILKEGAVLSVSFDTINTGVNVQVNQNSGLSGGNLSFDGTRKAFTSKVHNVNNSDGDMVTVLSLADTFESDCGLISNVQIETRGFATAYKPNYVKTFSIDLKGNVYGGSLDWNNGGLTMTHQLYAYKGTELWAEEKSGDTVVGFSLVVSGVANTSTNPDDNYAYGSHFVLKDRLALSANSNAFAVDSGKLFVYPDSKIASTLEQWKTYLTNQAKDGRTVSFVLPLLKPTQQSLLGLNDICSFRGVNTVYSDFNTVSVKCFTSFEDKIDKKADAKSVAEAFTDNRQYNNDHFMSAFKKTVSGSVISVDDVDSIEHRVECRISLENKVKMPYSDLSGENNGVTYTTQPDGSVIMSGTAREDSKFNFKLNRKGLEGFDIGKTYCISKYGKLENTAIIVNYYDANGSEHSGIASSPDGQITFTPLETWKGIHIYVTVFRGATVNDLVCYPKITLNISDLSKVLISRHSHDNTNKIYYTPLLDGTVPGMTSVSPDMIIESNTTGVNITAEYNRDAYKYVQSLEDRIVILESYLKESNSLL